MAGITLAEALKAFGREVGVQEGRDCLIDDIRCQTEFMLYHGGGEFLREWCLLANSGKFTFPYDLEAPIKYQFGDKPGMGLGVWESPFYSYSTGALMNCCGFNTWNKITCQVLPNRTPTQYQPPRCCSYIMATTCDDRDVGKHIQVSGKFNGFELAPIHHGYKTAGEILPIYHRDDPDKKHSSYAYDEVTAVTKDLTCDYVTLSGFIKDTKVPFFLSHYHPDEETPMYQQGLIRGCGMGCDVPIRILGRINPSIRYIRDEQILPITSYDMLSVLAKRCRYDKASDFENVVFMEQRLRAIIRTQVMYQQKSGQDVSFDLAGSGATLSNI